MGFFTGGTNNAIRHRFFTTVTAFLFVGVTAVCAAAFFWAGLLPDLSGLPTGTLVELPVGPLAEFSAATALVLLKEI